MIRAFGDRRTADLFHGRDTSQARRIATTIRSVATRKLDLLTAAITLEDLPSPLGDRLDALSGDLKGFHSIPINEQWRTIFQWKGGGAEKRVS